ETINRIIAATPNSNLMVAVPTSSLMRSIKYGGNQVENVFTLGTTSDFTVTSPIDCKEGRFFNEIESRSGAQVVVIGYDVADALSGEKYHRAFGSINHRAFVVRRREWHHEHYLRER